MSSPSDKAFQAKYGHAPVKAQAKPVQNSREELEQLRSFKAANQNKIAQANASHIEATGKPLPVKVQAAPVDAKATKRARLLASAKATHAAVQNIRADAGLTRLEFDQAFFDHNFERLHADRPLRDKGADAKALNAAMKELAVSRGQKLSANNYKTPAQLAEESRNRSPEEQRVAMNAAILNELRKL